MKKLCTYTSTHHTYSVPYDRVARIYESEEPVFKGCHFEVSTHSGGVGVDWEFKPFKTLQDAQIYALQFVAPSHILCKFKPEL
jgi:hypothetical protein